MKDNADLIAIVTITLLVIGGVITGGVISENNTNTDLQTHGTTAEVTVTDKDERSSMVGKVYTTDYYLTYTTPTENTAELEVDYTLYQQTNPGDTITICYTPNNARADYSDCAN